MIEVGVVVSNGVVVDDYFTVNFRTDKYSDSKKIALGYKGRLNV